MYFALRLRPFFRNLSLAVAAVVATSASVQAQNPEFLAIYRGTDPVSDFALSWKKEKAPRNMLAGRTWWEIPKSEFSTGGIDRLFTGFRSQVTGELTDGASYRYAIESPALPYIYNLEHTDDGVRESARRVTYVRELFGRYYLGASKTSDQAIPIAFQTALWEICNESEFPDKAAPFSLFTGNFQANYKLDDAPSYVKLAEQYLQSLTGDDITTFYDNTALAGRELVHLRAMPIEKKVGAEIENEAPANKVDEPNLRVEPMPTPKAPSSNPMAKCLSVTMLDGVEELQFVTFLVDGADQGPPNMFGLRDLGGGAPGFNGGTGVAGTGLGGGLGFGGGGAGSGAGNGLFTGGNGGGGGGSSGSSNGSSNGTNASSTGTTNPNDTVTTGDTPPGDTPPDTVDEPPSDTPPVEIDQHSTEPVPAPPAMVLGLIAVGIFAGRRAINRLHHKSTTVSA